MKAILEFNLPEDQSDYKVYSQAPKYHTVLSDFSSVLRDMHKYDEGLTKSQRTLLEDLRVQFYELITDVGLDAESL